MVDLKSLGDTPIFACVAGAVPQKYFARTTISVAPKKKALQDTAKLVYNLLWALCELVDNAIEASRGSGKACQIQITLSRPERTIVVEDDGKGLEPDEAKLWAALGERGYTAVEQGQEDYEDPNSFRDFFSGRLSKYGVGLKYACMALGSKFSLVTKTAGRSTIMESEYSMHNEKHIADVSFRNCKATDEDEHFTKITVSDLNTDVLQPLLASHESFEDEVARLCLQLASVYYFYVSGVEKLKEQVLKVLREKDSAVVAVVGPVGRREVDKERRDGRPQRPSTGPRFTRASTSTPPRGGRSSVGVTSAGSALAEVSSAGNGSRSLTGDKRKGKRKAGRLTLNRRIRHKYADSEPEEDEGDMDVVEKYVTQARRNLVRSLEAYEQEAPQNAVIKVNGEDVDVSACCVGQYIKNAHDCLPLYLKLQFQEANSDQSCDVQGFAFYYPFKAKAETKPQLDRGLFHEKKASSQTVLAFWMGRLLPDSILGGNDWADFIKKPERDEENPDSLYGVPDRVYERFVIFLLLGRHFTPDPNKKACRHGNAVEALVRKCQEPELKLAFRKWLLECHRRYDDEIILGASRTVYEGEGRVVRYYDSFVIEGHIFKDNSHVLVTSRDNPSSKPRMGTITSIYARSTSLDEQPRTQDLTCDVEFGGGRTKEELPVHGQTWVLMTEEEYLLEQEKIQDRVPKKLALVDFPRQLPSGESCVITVQVVNAKGKDVTNVVREEDDKATIEVRGVEKGGGKHSFQSKCEKRGSTFILRLRDFDFPVGPWEFSFDFKSKKFSVTKCSASLNVVPGRPFSATLQFNPSNPSIAIGATLPELRVQVKDKNNNVIIAKKDMFDFTVSGDEGRGKAILQVERLLVDELEATKQLVLKGVRLKEGSIAQHSVKVVLKSKTSRRPERPGVNEYDFTDEVEATAIFNVVGGTPFQIVPDNTLESLFSVAGHKNKSFPSDVIFTIRDDKKNLCTTASGYLYMMSPSLEPGFMAFKVSQGEARCTFAASKVMFSSDIYTCGSEDEDESESDKEDVWQASLEEDGEYRALIRSQTLVHIGQCVIFKSPDSYSKSKSDKNSERIGLLCSIVVCPGQSARRPKETTVHVANLLPHPGAPASSPRALLLSSGPTIEIKVSAILRRAYVVFLPNQEIPAQDAFDGMAKHVYYCNGVVSGNKQPSKLTQEVLQTKLPNISSVPAFSDWRLESIDFWYKEDKEPDQEPPDILQPEFSQLHKMAAVRIKSSGEPAVLQVALDGVAPTKVTLTSIEAGVYCLSAPPKTTVKIKLFASDESGKPCQSSSSDSLTISGLSSTPLPIPTAYDLVVTKAREYKLVLGQRAKGRGKGKGKGKASPSITAVLRVELTAGDPTTIKILGLKGPVRAPCDEDVTLSLRLLDATGNACPLAGRVATAELSLPSAAKGLAIAGSEWTASGSGEGGSISVQLGTGEDGSGGGDGDSADEEDGGAVSLPPFRLCGETGNVELKLVVCVRSDGDGQEVLLEKAIKMKLVAGLPCKLTTLSEDHHITVKKNRELPRVVLVAWDCADNQVEPAAMPKLELICSSPDWSVRQPLRGMELPKLHAKAPPGAYEFKIQSVGSSCPELVPLLLQVEVEGSNEIASLELVGEDPIEAVAGSKIDIKVKALTENGTKVEDLDASSFNIIMMPKRGRRPVQGSLVSHGCVEFTDFEVPKETNEYNLRVSYEGGGVVDVDSLAVSLHVLPGEPHHLAVIGKSGSRRLTNSTATLHTFPELELSVLDEHGNLCPSFEDKNVSISISPPFQLEGVKDVMISEDGDVEISDLRATMPDTTEDGSYSLKFEVGGLEVEYEFEFSNDLAKQRRMEETREKERLRKERSKRIAQLEKDLQKKSTQQTDQINTIRSELKTVLGSQPGPSSWPAAGTQLLRTLLEEIRAAVEKKKAHWLQIIESRGALAATRTPVLPDEAHIVGVLKRHSLPFEGLLGNFLRVDPYLPHAPELASCLDRILDRRLQTVIAREVSHRKQFRDALAGESRMVSVRFLDQSKSYQGQVRRPDPQTPPTSPEQCLVLLNQSSLALPEPTSTTPSTTTTTSTSSTRASFSSSSSSSSKRGAGSESEPEFLGYAVNLVSIPGPRSREEELRKKVLYPMLGKTMLFRTEAGMETFWSVQPPEDVGQPCYSLDGGMLTRDMAYIYGGKVEPTARLGFCTEEESGSLAAFKARVAACDNLLQKISDILEVDEELQRDMSDIKRLKESMEAGALDPASASITDDVEMAMTPARASLRRSRDSASRPSESTPKRLRR